MNKDLSIINTNLKHIEKVLLSLRERHYDQITQSNQYIKEDNDSLRIGTLRKKRSILKPKYNSNDSRAQIEALILNQTNHSSIRQFHLYLLNQYEDINTSTNATEKDILVIISDILFSFKRTNVLICKDNDIQSKAQRMFIDKITSSKWKNEHFLISFINLFEIFPLIQKTLFDTNDIITQCSIEVQIILISIFYHQEQFDYKDLIALAIETNKETVMDKIIRIYPEALDHLVNENQLTEPISINTVIDILQLANLKRESNAVMELIERYTKYNSNEWKVYTEYYKIVFKLLDNKENSNHDLLVRVIEGLIKKLIELKDWMPAYNIISSNKKQKDSISEIIINDLISIMPFDQVTFISNLIRIKPSLYDKVVKSYIKQDKIKELTKLIVMLNDDIPLNRDLFTIAKKKALKKFYNYKYQNCKEQLDILTDFIINDPPFFNFILKRYINQAYIPETLFLLNLALNNSITLKESLLDTLMKQYGYKDLQCILKASADLNTIVLDNDVFGPKHNTSYSLSPDVNVLFADTPLQVKLFFNDYFTKATCLGIDSEWKQNYTAFDKPEVSILQIADEAEKNIIVIDILKLKGSKEFIEELGMLKQKKLIGYSFQSSDLDKYGDKDIEKLSSECTIVDLSKQPYSDKVSVLSLCKQRLNKEICKYAQCSNWNNRPLKKIQLHYAAVDALVCIQLFKTYQTN